MEEIRDVHNDNIDVLVENENGYNYIIGVGTPQDLLEEMNQEKTNFVRPGTPKIIVKKLTKEIVAEAIQAYAEDTGLDTVGAGTFESAAYTADVASE